MKKIVFLSLVISLLKIFHSEETKKEKNISLGSLEDKKILIIIAPLNFRDEELFDPLEILKEKKIKVTIASTSLEKAKGMLGKEIMPEKTIKQIKPEEFDGLIIVGGIGTKTYLWSNKELIDLVIAMDKKKKIIGALCLAPVILAKAKILKAKKATVFETNETLQEFKINEVKYINKDVVTDEHIITANGPSASKKFAYDFVKLLKEKMYNVSSKKEEK